MPSKTQLTEEEKIARKVKLRRTISYIFGACALVAIIIFVIFAMGTKKNINVNDARAKSKRWGASDFLFNILKRP